MKNKWGGLEFAPTDRKYRDSDCETWEYRHGVWGSRCRSVDDHWYPYAGPIEDTYNYGPFWEIDE